MDAHALRPLATSTAPQLEPLPEIEIPKPAVPPPASQPNVNYQPLLFRDPANGPKVIPIPTLTPMRSREQDAPAKRAPRAPRANSRHIPDSQQSLDFFETHPHIESQHGTPRTIGTQVEAVIYCDAPVALPAHRAIAAAFDTAMILSAVGVFLTIFFVSGGMIALTKENIPFFLGVAVVITLFYRFLFALADGDTPGMRFAGLRLVDFDGRKPDREQRGMRQIAGILSLLSAGLGLVWALVDEESLTWHDHISKTFPTVG
ncbi:MAG: RDD family protein [Acidobacteriia bacterium]|nr:RDD family protein [Terriglobia bacterium]